MAGEGESAALDAKQEGNDHFKGGRLELAVQAYSRALESQPDCGSALCVQCLNNRAMCLIKLERFEEARVDLDRVLQHEPGNVKALYRRGCASRRLAQYADAVRDAIAVLQVNPKNAAAQTLARESRRLAEQENSQLGQLARAAIDAGHEDGGIAPLRLAAFVSERDAANELVRWRGGEVLSALWAKRGSLGAPALAPLLAVAGSDLSPSAAGEALLPHIPCDELASAVKTATDTALRRKLVVLATALANAPSLRDDAALSLCHAATYALNWAASASEASADVAQTQRAALQVAATVCQPRPQLARRAIRDGLLLALVDPVEAPDGAESHALPIADASEGAVAAVLGALAPDARRADESWRATREAAIKRKQWEAKERKRKEDEAEKEAEEKEEEEEEEEEGDEPPPNELKKVVESTARALLSRDRERDNLRACVVLSGAVSADGGSGAWVAAREDVLAALCVMAQSPREAVQERAASVMAAVASEESGREALTAVGKPLLSSLAGSSSPHIRASAALALAKLAGTNVEGDNPGVTTAVDAALSVLAGPSSPLQCKGQGVEALSFLLRSTAVKQRFADTLGAYDALVALAKADPSKYGVAVGSAVAQLATTVREQRQLALRELEVGVEEWEKLQRVAKERIEDSDTRKEANARCEAIVRAGVVHVLGGAARSAEGRSDGPTVRRVVAEALHNLAHCGRVRGKMLQEGALPCAVSLATAPETRGMESQATTERLKAAKAFAPAAQCVAKLLISTDPRQLPHSAVLDAVPVLVRLCGVEDPLLQFEGLMAATNVASTGDEALDRLIAAKAVHTFELCQCSSHPAVKRAATEALCNLAQHPAAADHLLKPDRLRLWAGLAASVRAGGGDPLSTASDTLLPLPRRIGGSGQEEEEFETRRAAAGGLAIMVQGPERMKAVLEAGDKVLSDILTLLRHENEELQHRAVAVLSSVAGKQEGLAALHEHDALQPLQEAASRISGTD